MILSEALHGNATCVHVYTDLTLTISSKGELMLTNMLFIVCSVLECWGNA